MTDRIYIISIGVYVYRVVILNPDKVTNHFKITNILLIYDTEIYAEEIQITE